MTGPGAECHALISCCTDRSAWSFGGLLTHDVVMTPKYVRLGNVISGWVYAGGKVVRLLISFLKVPFHRAGMVKKTLGMPGF